MKNQTLNLKLISICLLLSIGIWNSTYIVISAEPTLDFRGISYELAYHDNPEDESTFSEDQIRSDLKLFQKLNVNHLRTFGTKFGQDLIPQIANEYGITCATGAWVSWNATDSMEEIDRLLTVADDSELLIVGTETRTRGEVSETQLVDYISYVKNHTDTLVTTCEPWHLWVEDSDLAEISDVIFISLNPITDAGFQISNLEAYIQDALNWISVSYPLKEIYFSIGWPSDGHELGTDENQKAFYESLFEYLGENDLSCYIFEDFDVANREIYSNTGNAGTHFGIFDEDRDPKPVINVFNTNFGGSIRINGIPAPSFMITAGLSIMLLFFTLNNRQKKKK